MFKSHTTKSFDRGGTDVGLKEPFHLTSGEAMLGCQRRYVDVISET